MKQILVATHGKMASGIHYTAELIVGKTEGFTTIDAYMTPEDDVEQQLEKYFNEHAADRIFAFTDLMGGSVNQKLMKYASRENVTLITGTNLPVLMQVMMAEETVSDVELQEYIDEARNELQMVYIEKPAGKQEKKSVENVAKEPLDFEKSTAKIAALRVDDRLIHGQVAMTWSKQLRVQGIVVANDDASNDNTQKMALKMAVPSGIKVLIKPVREAIQVLNDPRASQMRILVLTKNIKDALEIRRQVGEIEFLNIGNVGRFDGIDVAQKKILTPTIMLTDQEAEALKELSVLDPETCIQQVPNDERKLVKEVLDKLE